MSSAADNPSALRIVHVLRAPLGGLFRHVVDLATLQAARGHAVGLVTDLRTGGDAAAARLDALSSSLSLGVMRFPMHRLPHHSDVAVLWRIHQHLSGLALDVVHGHGAKGGLYARAPALLQRTHAVRAYTPHGGSFNYRPGSRSHRLYMGVERLLARGTDLLLFESNYIAGRYDKYVGMPNVMRRTIVNGVGDNEFVPVTPDQNAADLLYVGELRSAKGIDTLIDALATAGRTLGAPPSLVLVGSGPDEKQLAEQAQRLGVQANIRFAGPMPARAAFRLGRHLVVPSRAESLPYVVLEAAAARVPMIATRVGGIPEIFGPHADRLVAADDAHVLANAIVHVLRSDPRALFADAAALAAFVATRFTMDAMVDGVLSGYADARRNKHEASRSIPPKIVMSN